MKHSKEDILNIVKNEDVEFIRLQFTDIFGNLKNMAVTTSQIDKVLNNQCVFDAGAIDSIAGSKKSELVLYPDLDTFTIFPWRPQTGKVARFICDVYNPDGTPYEADSRYILKKVIKEAKNMGYIIDLGPECEFFLFDSDEDGNSTVNTGEKGTYFDIGPIDKGENARRDLVMTLEDMDFEVRASYHEVSPAQHEIDFKNDDALNTADNLMTFRMTVRTVAKRHGLHATFMPKPRTDFGGSGMTLNFAMYNEMGKNVFASKSDENGLSNIAYSFIAGLLEHQGALTAICNPIINSYKRLRHGENVPSKIGWSSDDRDMCIRVPANTEVCTISLRSPDSAANPYIAIAVCIAAGLDGIKRNLKIEKQGGYLPGSLNKAIELLKKDEFIIGILGKLVATKFIEEKEKEWDDYCRQTSEWEIDRYLDRI